MKNLIDISFAAESGKFLRGNGSVTFRAEGPQLEKFTLRTFTAKEAFCLEEYLVLDYRCQAVRRSLLRRGTIIWGTKNGEEIPLVCYDDLSMDNKRHTLMVKVPAGDYDGLVVRFAIDRRTHAEFQVFAAYSCTYSELPTALSNLQTATSKAYRTLDLTSLYNCDFAHADPNMIIDGGRFFDSGSVNILDIPFAVNGKVIAPPPPPAENDEEILNFKAPAKRRLCRPVSRNSLVCVPVGGKATEIFFLLALTGKQYQRWGFATDGTILGSPDGEVTMPVTVTDVEGFMVEIVYADGRHDTAMPLQLNVNRHVMQGDFSAYAVPADGSEVVEVIFHNRLLDTDCNIVAVTVNDTDCRQFPQMLIPEAPEEIIRDIPAEKSLSLVNNILTVRNGAISMTIDAANAMTLTALHNAFAPKQTISPASMFAVISEDRDVYKDIAFVSAAVEGTEAKLVYTCQVGDATLELTSRIRLCGDNDVNLYMDVKNLSETETRVGVIFPAISSLNFTDWDDAWYFLPKYQNIHSNENIFMYEESAPSYPMQFMDVYSAAQQGGVSLTTQERDVVDRKYVLAKDEDGVSFSVEYTHMYGQLAPGQVNKCSPTVLTAHPGDWRASFALYKKWLDSWYTPYKCQNKAWYRKCFWLIAEITDFFETTSFTKQPVWYDPETKHFNFLDIMEEQKSLTGYYPDILHLWAWAYYPDKGHMEWGNFGGQDYDFYGGMEKFRDALWEVKEKTGSQVSLYLHPTLLSERYPQSKEWFPKYRVINESGNFISLGKKYKAYRMCHANETWREHAIKMYPRIYDELNIPLLYVDEFSLRIENRCYGEGHGHCVPSNLLKTDRDFISQLKDTMPEHVVLYGEYAAVDINARYIDCNISYSYIDTVVDMIETAWRAGDGDDRLSRVLTDMYRFAFPKIVQLNLPMAMRNLSWHPQKFIFFNGEAIYDSFWDIEESRGHEFTIHAYSLKKKYDDCFSSDTPSTMIDTLTPAVCANCFPGEGRTLYTIYNRAYSTYRGKVLRVPHQDGNEYYDAWNDKPLAVEIKDGFAELSVDIDAMQMGCLVITHNDPKGA